MSRARAKPHDGVCNAAERARGHEGFSRKSSIATVLGHLGRDGAPVRACFCPGSRKRLRQFAGDSFLVRGDSRNRVDRSDFRGAAGRTRSDGARGHLSRRSHRDEIPGRRRHAAAVLGSHGDRGRRCFREFSAELRSSVSVSLRWSLLLPSMRCFTGSFFTSTRGTSTQAVPPASATLRSCGFGGFPVSRIVAIMAIVIVEVFIQKTSGDARFVSIGTSRARRAPRRCESPSISLQHTSWPASPTRSPGFLLSGYLEVPSLMIGKSYLLPTVAAVVLGGTSLLGGVGSVAATAVGRRVSRPTRTGDARNGRARRRCRGSSKR